MRITHAHLAADPGTTDVDSVTRAGVAWLLLLEKVQDAFGAEGGPLRGQPVVLVCQCSAAAYGDQSGSRSAGKIGMSSFFVVIPCDRHIKSLTAHRRQGPRDHPVGTSWMVVPGRARMTSDLHT